MPTHLGEVDPGDFHDKEAFVEFGGLGTAEVTGSAGWSGTRETESSVHDAAAPVVELPVPEP